MSKYPGRRISATPPSVSTSAASGVWTLEEVAQYRQAGTWPVGVAGGDPYFNQTVLLLHGDGNQGANNLYNPGPPRYLAFTDNSDNNFPITVNGDAYGDNFSPFMTEAGQWSNFFDGSNDALAVAGSTDFQFGTGDFCVEAFVYLNALSTGDAQYIGGTYDGGNGGWAFNIQSGSTTLQFRNGDAGVVNRSFTFALGTWYHIAVTRSSSVLRFFVNGTQVGADESSYTQNITRNNSNGCAIGRYVLSNGSNGSYVNGYISNFRVVKGSPVYTSSFTPLTAPLTAITNTQLLTCQGNRFFDANTQVAAKTITRVDAPLVKPFNPFTTTYSSTNGSGYFDGTGDWLTPPDNTDLNLTSGDFTLSFWIYRLNGSRKEVWVTFRGFTVYFDSGSYIWTGATALSIGTVTINSWNHIQVVKSGSNVYSFVNGVVTNHGAVTFSNNQAPQIGAEASASPFTGYIADLRVVKGTALNTTSFTPPTALSTAVSGTSLLTCQYQGSVRNVGFIDSSPYDHVITRNGNTTQGTFSPFSAEPGKWGNFFDGANNTYLSIANTADLDQSGDFTQEVWYCRTADGFGSVDVLFIKNITNYLYIGVTQGTGVVTVNQHNIGTIITGTTATAIGVWYHLAVTRSGSSVRLFVNGVQEGSTVTYSTNTTGTAVSYIGGFPSAHAFAGYLSNLRVVAGRAVYTSNFTPSTSPLGLTSGGTNPPQGSETKLLTCFDNRFVDNSSSPKIITRNGDVRVTPFSPFAPSAAYSAGTNGGSGYFDGTGDYLITTGSTAFAVGTGPFTLEGWCYFNNVDTNGAGFGTCASAGSGTDGTNDRGVSLFLTGSGAWRFRIGRSSVGQFEDFLSTTTLTVGQWYHFKIVRTSTASNDTRVYLNGIQEAIGTSTININMQKFAVGIYTPSDTSAAFLNGYVAGVRFTGTAESSSVPSAPPLNVTGTRYLLNFTNAGIFDQTGKNVLETVGNAQIDTTTKKFGTGSMEFDGDDYLTSYQVPLFNFGSENFTLECWLYPTAYGGFFGKNQTSDYRWMKVDVANTGVITFYVTTNGSSWAVNQGSSSASGAWVLNTWWHFALVRNGTSFKIYKDGTEIISATVSGSIYNIDADPFILGSTALPGFAFRQSFTGYIDDLRVTKGVARYPSQPFPTAPFLNQ